MIEIICEKKNVFIIKDDNNRAFSLTTKDLKSLPDDLACKLHCDICPNDHGKTDITKDESISDREYEIIKNEVLRKKLIKKGYDLLERKDYSLADFRKRMLAISNDEELIEFVMSYFSKMHALDDKRIVSHTYDTLKNTKSKKEIIFMLKQKGIDEKVIDAFESDDESEENFLENEINAAMKYLKKRWSDFSQIQYEDRQKLMAGLYRKGFSQISIREAFERLKEESD